uniref:Uncharacterized protein n=1 Tax=Aegilops tauschii subsp. strangulata TaxID=200361 RepID=A0A453HBB5_AEGTS
MAGKQKVVTLLHLIVAYKDETEYNLFRNPSLASEVAGMPRVGRVT